MVLGVGGAELALLLAALVEVLARGDNCECAVLSPLLHVVEVEESRCHLLHGVKKYSESFCVVADFQHSFASLLRPSAPS